MGSYFSPSTPPSSRETDAEIAHQRILAILESKIEFLEYRLAVNVLGLERELDISDHDLEVALKYIENRKGNPYPWRNRSSEKLQQ
jgi:hypothetical protein